MPEAYPDTNVIQIPASVIVYKAIFSGVTYDVAAQNDGTGWTLIVSLPDSAANALTVIQTALNTLTAGRTWQEKLAVEGNYTVNGTILVSSYTILELHGSIVLQANANVNLVQNSDPVGGNGHIIIIQGRYDGNGTNQTADMSTIYMANVTYSKFLDFYVTGGHRSISGSGEGLELYGSSFNVIESIHAYSNQYDGIKLRNNSLYNTVTACVCWDNWASGVQCAYGANNNTIEGNTVYTTARVSNPLTPYTRGFSVHTAESNTFTGNTIYNVNRGILVLAGAATGTYHNTFSANTIINTEYGIYSMAAGGLVQSNAFNDNIIFNIDEAGIYVGNMGFKYNMISGNYIMTAGTVASISGAGIAFTGTSNVDNKIEENYIYNVTQDGIVISAAAPRNEIKLNLIHTAGDNGISVEAACDYTDISGNRVYNCGEDGIQLADGSDLCTIRGNFVYANGTTVGTWHGIHLLGGDENSITGNSVIANDTDGIMLEGDADNNFIDGNFITDNGRFGINISVNTVDNTHIGVNHTTGNISNGINDSSLDNTIYDRSQVVCGNGSSWSAGNTYFSCIEGSRAANISEQTVQTPISKACVFRHLFVYLTANPGVGKTVTVTLDVDAIGSALTVAITNAQTGNNTTNRVIVTTANILSMSVAATAASAAGSAGYSMEMIFEDIA